MDILEIIKDEHEEIESMAKDVEEAAEGEGSGSLDDLFSDLKNFVAGHMKAEEDIFYPAIKEADKKAFYEALEEHDLLRLESEGLEEMKKGDERWAAKFKVMKDLNDHHIEEEEGNVFKIARKEIPADERDEMGKRFEEMRGGSSGKPDKAEKVGKASRGGKAGPKSKSK